MTANLLAVTPDSSFGESIRQSLNDTGSFRVHLAKGKADAILMAGKRDCSLVLLDMELGENTLLEIGLSLRSMNSEINLVILADNELSPAMDTIRPWVLLRKPFNLPDFIQLIQAETILSGQLLDALENKKTSNPIPQPPTESDNPEIPWLNDVSKAAQHLTRLTLESAAQAALITREKNLWAYAGQLSQGAAKELAQIVSRHWDSQKGNDLLRFVRLEATKAEHMLYATQMTTDVILSLVFDTETPFSTIRSQANGLAHSLSIARTGPVPMVEKKLSLPPQPMKWVQPEAGSEADELGETHPHSIAEMADHMLVEPTSAAMAQLNFACLLLPRFTTHYLTGDLADFLSTWMPEICIAFGWRLEYLAVRPEYLQWVVSVRPNHSPGYLMRIVRQQTSERIFSEFPRLKRENPSGNFWAPGYLILGSLQPHPPQLVKDYIKQTRQRQGITQ